MTTPSAHDHLTRGADPGVCGRCAEHSPTCCVIPAEDLECCFPLSDHEVSHLHAHAGLHATTQVPNSRRFIEAMRSLFPGEGVRIEQLFPKSGAHMRLAVKGDGSCLFLGHEGCTLPRELRPNYCKTYPFWLNRGTLSHFASKSCHAQKESRNLNGLMTLFGITEERIRELYANLRAGWGLPPGR